MLLGITLGYTGGIMIGVVLGVGATIGHGSFYLAPEILTLKVSYF